MLLLKKKVNHLIIISINFLAIRLVLIGVVMFNQSKQSRTHRVPIALYRL